ncbi:SusC/RagA family TonB-linked outer membrane protein [Gemmatimonadetes bacterium T265]|nr:SusC/RagA family TonB-linked outer membrane protein [Gemmatimonadetes bacterium T265]
MPSSSRGVRRASAVLALAPAVLPPSGAAALTAAALVGRSAPAGAQQPAATGVVSGRVVERGTNTPLGSVQVYVVGGNQSALTNDNGTFRITGVLAGTVEVRARRLGYALTALRATVVAGAPVTLNFTLDRSQAQSLSEIVVTATGAEQAARETGNQVARITPDQQPLPAITSGSELLEGKAAGVVITQSGGASGSGARVRIRGGNSLSNSNEPLLIIDGVRVNSDPNSSSLDVGGQYPSRINDLKPEDIENVEILKGPAATGLYGTQAANGVIQVTTKRGVRGRTQYTAFAEGGALDNPYTFPLNTVGFGTTSTGAVTGSCYLQSLADGSCVKQDSLQSFQPLNDPRTTPFRVGNRQRYGASAAGGGDRATYYLSGDYEDEKGVYQNSGIRRINLRTNATAQLRSNLDLTANLGYLNLNNPRPQNDNNDQGFLGGGLLGSTQYDTLRQGYLRAGPAILDGITTVQTGDRLTGGSTLNYRPLTWLRFVGQAGLDIFNRDDQYLAPYGLLTLFDPDRAQGQRNRNEYRIATYTGNASAIATRTLPGDVTSTTTVGLQYQRDRTDGTQSVGYNILPGTGTLSTTNSRFAVAEDQIETRLFGALASEQIGFRDRVFVTGSVRGDNNSAFGQNVGFITYPSANASWVLSDESFFPKLAALNSFRLRAAIGKSGQRPQQLAALRYFNPVAVSVTGNDVPGFTIGNLGNTNLRPEITTEGEVGFDAGLFDRRVDLQVTYFGRRTRDQLVAVPIAPSVGTGPDAPTRTQNIGTVTNKGLEVGLTTTFVRQRTVGFDITWNFATLANHVYSLRDTTPIIFGFNSVQQHRTGYPAGSYFQVPFTYNDANHDGIITPDEVHLAADGRVQYLGNPLPRRTLSVQPALTLGPNSLVRLQALVDYRGGWKQFNGTEIYRCLFGICPELSQKGSSLFDQARAIASNDYGDYAGYVEKGDFVKLRELSASIALPRPLLFGKASNGTLTFAGRNLLTSTKYSGLDPEANGAAQQNWSQFDFLSQPPVRLFSVRLSYNY